jgi:hypothetical protein
MTNRGDLQAWSFKELLAAERRRDAFAIDATEIRAEIARRRVQQRQAFILVALRVLIFAAVQSWQSQACFVIEILAKQPVGRAAIRV